MTYRLQNKKTLIIISGGSGTGKSTTAKELLSRIEDRITVLSYDDIKEAAWDKTGFDNAEQKKLLDGASLLRFYEILDETMTGGVPVVIEYPFYQYHRDELERLVKKNGYDAVTVYLHTDPQTAYENGVLRDNAGARHPGHLLTSYHKETFRPSDLDEQVRHVQTYEEFLEFISGRNYNVGLGKVIDVDVTAFGTISYDRIAKEVCGG